MLCAVKTSRAPSRSSSGSARERRADVIGVRLDESGMLVPVADVDDVDVGAVPAREQRVARVADVLAVLRAAGVAALRRGEHADRAADAGARHLGQRVRQERMPVAHADVDRQRQPARGERVLQRRRLAQRQLGQRRDAAEALVVVRDFFDPLRADPAAAQHVLEKRPHVGRPLRSAERHEQDGVERSGHAFDQDYTGL